MTLFYPAAALYAALMLPVSVFWRPAWHPQEMLFGFALAVVAGNQLGAVSPRKVWLVFAAWVLARIGVLVSPQLFVPANALFAGLLAWHAAPRLFRTAKKLRNQALPALLVALAAAAAAQHVRATVLLLAALMLFMGGRILAPAIAGQLQRQGVTLGPRVQPQVEGALLVLMLLAVLFFLFEKKVSGTACIAAGALAMLRMARWRLWAVRGRPDLLCLAAGYAWLALGLLAVGAAFTAGRHESTALHLITVGALGTLTFNVMAMGWLLKARAYPSRISLIVAGTLLLAAATAARVFGALEIAALGWSAAYAVLLAIFFSRSPTARGHPA